MRLFLLSLLAVFALFRAAAGNTGDDLRALFAGAAAGKPVTAVALGGSITQGGRAWVDPWLKEAFPNSRVSIFNAGISGTGCHLGIFRLERDVIALQPDLVLIEYAVNDGGLSDEDAVRYLESLVVRLKQMPHPPAIVFIETAARQGSVRYRHEKVAAHYNLVNIDLQVKLDEYLKKTGTPWEELMNDEVHPNAAGYRLYWNWIAEALAPYLPQKGASVPEPAPLPKPLSAKPLILDGKMIPLAGLSATGWKGESTLSAWYDRVFLGTLNSTRTPAPLELYARGTELGLFYILDRNAGSFRTSVDGRTFAHIDCDIRNGYGYQLFGKELEPRLHKLLIRPLSDKPVKLGYLLVAGDTAAAAALASQGPVDDKLLANFKWTPVPASGWQWAGPFGGETVAWPSPDFQTPFAPETAEKVEWKEVPPAGGETIDFGKLTGKHDRGVCYAKTTLNSKGGKLLLGIKADYFAKLWINGKLVATLDGPHGGASHPVCVRAELNPGDNEIIAKIHSGSQGFAFGLLLEDDLAQTLSDEVVFQ
ncbi:MAG: lysophospholipase [Lentisphaeria bacterium]|nr:lysophospholipase [Lentisphaeria bacterium]